MPETAFAFGVNSQGVPPGSQTKKHPGKLGLQIEDLRFRAGAAVIQ
jgi:hypothetical protein